jgi:hypothetical protein
MNMPKKFITLNFRCSADYLNADWIFSKVVSYYINKFNLKNCPHVSLSVGAFTTLLWKFAGTLYDVDFPALTTEQLALIHDFIAAGAGIIYDEATSVIEEYPENKVNEKRLNPIPEFPSLNAAGNTFEDFVNAACRRMTGAYDPLTGEEATPVPGTLYGIDAAHAYLLRVGDPPVQHRAIIRKQSLVNWIAAWLCGVERGEFGGPCPFGPNTLPQNLTESTELNPQNPEDIWLESYVNDFLETPFYWICGLQTFIPIKNLGDFDNGEPNSDSELTNLDEVRYDKNGVLWCFYTMVERAQWLINYLKTEEPVASKRVGAYITSKDCHAKQADWTIALQEITTEWPHYEKCRIPEGSHLKPTTLAEAHLKDAYSEDTDAVFLAWKAEFETWLDYIAQYWMTDEDIVLFSDREAKDMVVQQYALTNPPVTVDEDRLKVIVNFLVDFQNNWQYQLNEWNIQPEPILVSRPPDYVTITVDEEKEYYSLAEAYWHMLSALNDLAKGEEEIDYKTLEPPIGPCEPSVCPITTVDGIDEDDSVYRIFKWWQHDQTPAPSFSYETILRQIPALFNVSRTDIPVGPTYPDDSRQKYLRKVKALWTLKDDLVHDVDLNAAEILYLLAKTLAHFYDSENQPETFEMLPSHVLPKSYRKFLEKGRFKLIFGDSTENQLNWLDLGQRWTLKPAVLQEAYR